MKPEIIATMVVVAGLAFAGSAHAKGCLTGAAVGGVAGHVAGNHGVIGAGVGCAVGRHRANKKDKEMAAQQARPQTALPAQTATPMAPVKK